MKKQILIGLFGVVFVCLIPALFIMAVALWPYIGLLGMGLLFTAGVGMLCLCMLMIAFTARSVGIWRWERVKARMQVNLVTSGEIVVWLDGGEIKHLSAEHWKARALAAPMTTDVNVVRDDKPYREEDVAEMWLRGGTVETIAKAYRVHRDEIEEIVRRKG